MKEEITGLSEISTIFRDWCLQKGIWEEFVKTAKANPKEQVGNIFKEINRVFKTDDYGSPFASLLWWLEDAQWDERWQSLNDEWADFYDFLIKSRR